MSSCCGCFGFRRRRKNSCDVFSNIPWHLSQAVDSLCHFPNKHKTVVSGGSGSAESRERGGARRAPVRRRRPACEGRVGMGRSVAGHLGGEDAGRPDVARNAEKMPRADLDVEVAGIFENFWGRGGSKFQKYHDGFEKQILRSHCPKSSIFSPRKLRYISHFSMRGTGPRRPLPNLEYFFFSPMKEHIPRE